MAWFPLSGSSLDETFYDEENESLTLSDMDWTTSELKEDAIVRVGSKIDEVFILS